MNLHGDIIRSRFGRTPCSGGIGSVIGMRPSIQIYSGKSVTSVFGPGVTRIDDAGQKSAFIFAQNSGSGRHAGQGGLEKPADELRLAGGSGFLENAPRVGARRLPADFKPRGGGDKPVAGNDFGENACLGGGQPEPCGKALDLGAGVGGGVDNDDGGGGPVEVQDCHRPDGGERNDMGDKRRAILAAAELEGSTDIAFGCFVTTPWRASACRRAVSAGLVASSCPC